MIRLIMGSFILLLGTVVLDPSIMSAGLGLIIWDYLETIQEKQNKIIDNQKTFTGALTEIKKDLEKLK